MNIIYDTALQFLDSNPKEQEILYYRLHGLVKEAINNKQQDSLTQALVLAEKDNNVLLWNAIQEHLINNVDRFEYEKDGKKYVSYLILLPFMIFPSSNAITLPALEEVEIWWREALSDQFLLMPGGLEFNIAPVVLSKNNASTMSMLDWYAIHKANSLTLSKRSARSMFSSPFAIKTIENQANLNFFVATLNFEINSAKHIPLLNLNEEEIQSFQSALDLINEQFNTYVKDCEWLSMPVGTVTNVISHAFEAFQETLFSNMISKHYVDSNVQFVLVPNNNQKFFTIFAWHDIQRVVLDAVILTQYINDFSTLTNTILDYLKQYNVEALYVGDQDINLEEFNNLPEIDFVSYLKQYGVITVPTGIEEIS